MKVSLVAVDLDGTLLTRAHTPAPQGAALLTQVARLGVRVVIATTRLPDYVARLCRALGIDGPLICANGAQVWGSPDGPVWADRVIPRQVALEIARWADAHDCELSTTVGSTTYWRQRPGQALGPIAANIVVVPSNIAGIAGDPLRILVSQPEAIEGVRSLCRSRFLDRCYAEVYYEADGSAHSLGVFALGADKGTALALVCDRLGVAKEHVLAIGDNIGDVAMFRRAAVSVAMGNAAEEVKRQAAAVAPDNDAEGVAWALERFVLGNDGSQVVVRPARVKDAGRVAELATQLGYPTTSEKMRPRLAQVERAEGHAVYVAELDGRVVGWVHVCVRPLVQVERAAEIEGLVVDEACRGQGVGRLLVQQAERWAWEQGSGTMYVRSNVVREGAHAFYERAGYENIKTSLTFRKTLRDGG